MSWSITFRKARESDRRYFDWQPYYDDGGNGPFKPLVVAVDGEPFLVARLRSGASPVVLWQNGSPAVAPLLRMLMRYDDDLVMELNDDRWDKAERRRRRERAGWFGG